MTELLTESGHKTRADADRHRIVCTECSWFKWDPESTVDGLKQMGYRHRDATRLR